MDIIKVPDIITKSTAESIKRIMFEYDVPWHYTSETVGDNAKNDKYQFVHHFFERGVVTSHLAEMMLNFFQKLPEFKTHHLMRFKANLTSPYKVKMELPHIDNENIDSVSYLYYVHDCDGPTVFYPNWWRKMKIYPKQGLLIKFPSNIKHGGITPFKCDRRIVFTLIFHPTSELG